MEGMKRIQEENLKLKNNNEQLQETLGTKEEEAVEMQEQIKKIPEIERKRKELHDEITALQVKLQDANFEKHRVKNELENENLHEIKQIASSLTQMLV